MNWMTAGALAGAVILGGVTTFLAVALIRLWRYRRAPADAFEAGYEPLRYSVMRRLIAEEDFEFLAAQPGYRPEIGARLRRDRRRIFRMYLRSLAQDFHSLHAAARKTVADAPERHADLVGMLVQCQVTFWRRMLMVELRLLSPASRLPQFDIAQLLQPMESIRVHLADA